MKSYAVTSGKGGVGKTCLSANLGIALAEQGLRVILFDADIGLANLDIILGTKSMVTLQDTLSGACTLQQAISAGPGGISFIAGGSGVESLLNLSGPLCESFLMQVEELASVADVLIFDTGAGIDDNVLTFLQAADEVLLVATPDPSSLTDAYATTKALLRQRKDAKISVVMNMVDNEREGRSVFNRLQDVCRQFLKSELCFAGSVRMDPGAAGWVRKRRPYLLADPNLPASKDVRAVATNLLGVRPTSQETSFASRLRELLGLRKAA